MKHAGPMALQHIEPLLAALRVQPGLAERRPGVFYRGGRAFLHFHEDPVGLFADLRPAAEWKRLPMHTEADRAALLAQVGLLCRP